LLEAGISMLVLDACRPVPGGVDTPQDLEKVRAVLAAATR
jgi:CMP-2-keto-3-deoxyoctulosonic acid synthetase